MKKIFLTTLFFIGAFAIQAQELKWHTNIKEAIIISNKEKKPLFLFFTGSDWCGWCIRLQNEVLKTPEFTKWAKDNVVLVELDYPRKLAQTPELKKQNAGLLQNFGVQGFPTVCFATTQKKKKGGVDFTNLGQTGYVAGGPSAWVPVADKIIHPEKP